MADGREDLGEEVLKVFLCDDFLKGMTVEVLEKVDEFLQNGKGFILEGNRVHIGGCNLFVPVFLRQSSYWVLYHVQSQK